MCAEESTVIGSGAFGFVVVFGENTKKAAKYILKSPQTDDETFRKECEALERFQHPNIVQYFGFKEIGDYNVIEMEYCERKSLSDVLKDPSIIYSMQTVYGWSKHLLDAFLCLQKVGIVHRDIKPSNVLVTRDFILKLGDFGSVRLLDPNSLTTTITLAGTFRYMSPEAYGYPNQRLITSSTDLYSIGLVIWEIVERRLVHSDYSTSKIFKEYDFFYDLWHGKYSLEEIKCTDRKLKDLVIRCTNIHPGKRPNLDECAQSIEWLIEQAKDDLEPLLAETQNVLIRPIGFDGTKQWVPAVDRTVFDSLSFNLKSTKTPTKSKTLSKRRQMIEVTLAKGNNSSNNSRPMNEEERFLVNDGSEHESRKVNKRMLCLFLWMLLSCITFALLMFIWNFVASGDLRNSFSNQSISQNASNDAIFTKWTTNNQTLISAVDLTIGYKLLKALSDIKLALPEHEINAIIRPEYLFDLDEKPYANGQQNSFVVYQPTNGTLDEKLSGLLREFDLLYVELVQLIHSLHRNLFFKIFETMISVEKEGLGYVKAGLSSDLEQIFQMRNDLSKVDVRGIDFDIIFFKEQSTGYFLVSVETDVLLLGTDFTVTKILSSEFSERLRSLKKQSETQKFKFNVLRGFRIDLLFIMLVGQLLKIKESKNVPVSSLRTSIRKFLRQSEEYPFVQYRFHLGHNLLNDPIFQKSSSIVKKETIQAYGELHQLFETFFALMQNSDDTGLIDNAAFKSLKAALQQVFECPNYFLFAKLQSNVQQLLLQFPTYDDEEVLTMTLDYKFTKMKVKRDDVDVFSLPLQIITQSDLIETIGKLLERSSIQNKISIEKNSTQTL